MKRITTILVAMLVAFLMGGSWAWATQPTGHKVDVCHATSGEGELKNGYNLINVDIASAGYPDSEGNNNHASHDGTFGNMVGPDIIAAYEYQPAEGPLFVYPGYNLDYVFNAGEPNETTGAEFLANGCQFNTPPEEPEPFVPLASIKADCGMARVELAWKFGDETDEPQRSEEFIVLVDGKVWRTETLSENEDVWFPIDFKEDTGVHTISVTYGDETLADANVQSDCEKPEPKPTPTPEPTQDNPDKPDKPEGAVPVAEELPHTGGNLALAGIAGALLAAGSGLVWFSRRRLTDV
jgi:LPXTG-motif cell wall-anchored protein